MFGIRYLSNNPPDEMVKPDALTASVKIAVQRNQLAGMKVRETLREFLAENDRLRSERNENHHT